jgi:DNA invertase Pin-like site-specific DNA recombinase
MAIYGYARVSTTDQSCEIQETALRAAGCASILKEQKSGTTANRPQLQALRTIVQKGDVVMITRLDRLGRSLRDLLAIAEEFQNKGVSLKCLEQPIDTTGAAGRLFMQILGAFAEFEHAIRAERQAEGIAVAKANGAYKGRPRTVDVTLVRKLSADGKKPEEIARALNISRASAYRVIAQQK